MKKERKTLKKTVAPKGYPQTNINVGTPNKLSKQNPPSGEKKELSQLLNEILANVQQCRRILRGETVE